ncbi:MAG: 1-deoxy-D-xylulose-5-phosphate synthase [Bifidobacteriaceae bacterium]|nr:1-deoxy-D-xylulose-5-phosphate synthase [Bifidobacteriaceae bacterium]
MTEDNSSKIETDEFTPELSSTDFSGTDLPDKFSSDAADNFSPDAFSPDQIRAEIIDACHNYGGHLASNLGAVELTIALHKIFNIEDSVYKDENIDAKNDLLLFDVGHQVYAHKILTGRPLDSGKGLRQTGGITGYSNRSESGSDIIENSHSSTVFSWADGLISSLMYDNPRNSRRVVAVIGDGGLTGGMAWEGLNQLAEFAVIHPNAPLIIVINDNDYSYSSTVGGLARKMQEMRVSKRYTGLSIVTKNALSKLGKPGIVVNRFLHTSTRYVKNLIRPTSVFSDLNIPYYGPIDGNDLTQLMNAFDHAKNFHGPIIIHTITHKGLGSADAEESPAEYHAVGKQCGDTTLIKMSETECKDIVAKTIVDVASINEKLFVLSAAMPGPLGLTPFADKFPERFKDVGIAEQHLAGKAAGLAYMGNDVICALYSTFAVRGFDQFMFDVGLQAYNDKVGNITLLLDRAGVTGSDGASHNGLWDISLFSKIPGIKIVAPYDQDSLKNAISTATAQQKNGNFTVIRYPKSLPKKLKNSNADSIKDVLIVGFGSFGQLAIDLAKNINQSAIAIDQLYPVSGELIEKIRSSKVSKIVTLEDGIIEGGAGEALKRELEKQEKSNYKIYNFGVENKFYETKSRPEILEENGLTIKKLSEKLCN